MFIVPTTQGGYRGNVNLAFRKGRDDAFQDYLRNFNFAVQSDAYNNAENQANIQRLADNQKLQFDVTNQTRQDAVNFLKSSQEIPNEVYKTQVNFAKLNELQPQTNAIGQSMATTDIANLGTAENTAKFNNLSTANALDNSDVVFDAKNEQAKLAQQTAITQQKIVDLTNQGIEIKNQLVQIKTPEALNEAKLEVVKRRVAELEAQAKARGEPFDPVATRAQLLSDPLIGEKAQKLLDAKTSQLTSQLSVIDTTVNEYKKAVQAKTPKEPITKLPAEKEIKLDESIQSFENRLKTNGRKLAGINAYITNSGVYTIEGNRVRLRERPVDATTGKLVTDEQFLALLRAQLEPAKVINNSGGEGA